MTQKEKYEIINYTVDLDMEIELFRVVLSKSLTTGELIRNGDINCT